MNNEIVYHTVEIKVVQSKNTDYAIGSIVPVKELGGIWENEKFMYSPSVVFQLGEEVIVFLDDDSYVLHQCFKFNQISSGEFVRNDGVKYDAGFAERLFQKRQIQMNPLHNLLLLTKAEMQNLLYSLI